LGGVLTTPAIKKIVPVMKYLTDPRNWMDSLAQPKHQKTDIRFGTQNVRSLCRTGSLKMVARGLQKFKLDLLGVQEVKWEKGGPEWVEDYTLFCGEGNEDHQLGTGFFLYIRQSYQQLGEFVSDRMFKRPLVQYCCSECAHPM
jgi:hypothetical protein